MPLYTVLIPCTMAVAVTVEAENESAAANAALNVDFQVKLEGGGDAAPEINEFETHRKITHGNVYQGCINEIEVIEV